MPMLESVKTAFKLPDLRKKILFTLGMLAIFRLGAHVPVPGFTKIKLRCRHTLQLAGHLGRRRFEEDEPLCHVGQPLYHRVDYHAAFADGHPEPGAVGEGRRGGPAQDFPVYPLWYHCPGHRAGLGV